MNRYYLVSIGLLLGLLVYLLFSTQGALASYSPASVLFVLGLATPALLIVAYYQVGKRYARGRPGLAILFAAAWIVLPVAALLIAVWVWGVPTGSAPVGPREVTTTITHGAGITMTTTQETTPALYQMQFAVLYLGAYAIAWLFCAGYFLWLGFQPPAKETA
jgi:hypothetical protein